MKPKPISLLFITLFIAVLTILISIVVNLVTNVPEENLPPLWIRWIVLVILVVVLVFAMSIYQKREEQIKKDTLESEVESINPTVSQEDWGGFSQDVSNFYGREAEISELEQWVVIEKSKAIAICGVGGIGKTTIAIKLINKIRNQFDYVFYRELRNAPTLDAILSESIRFLSNQKETQLPVSLDKRLSLLLMYMQQKRCMFVLDNLEGIMQGGERVGVYQKGYEDYGKLIERLATNVHSSCLILTTREKPIEIELHEGSHSAVHSIELNSLGIEDSMDFLKDKGISGTRDGFVKLIDHYAGNPLWLKLVCPLIRVYSNNVDQFIAKREGAFFEGQRNVLDEHFYRLSDLEKEIMYWLAIDREAISIEKLRGLVLSEPSEEELIEVFGSLMNRYLIETAGEGASFKLQAVIMDYTTRQWIEKVYTEIITEEIYLYKMHPLIMAQGKEYIRRSQTQIIIKPLAQKLLGKYKKDEIEVKLDLILSKIRKKYPKIRGYAGGNTFNLLHYLECDLSRHDFSNTALWDAYLREGEFQHLNLANCEIARCAFIDVFGGILSVSYSPNGKLLATGDTNGNVYLWDMGDGRLVFKLQGHGGWVRTLSFDRDNEILASGADDQTIKLWNVSTGHHIKTLYGHSSHVRSLTFSPLNRQVLVSGSADRTLKIWDVTLGSCMATLKGHLDWIRTVSFSPDGQILATGSHDHTIKIWNVITGTCYKTLEGHTGQVVSITFSPDSKTLASASHDCTIKLWDLQTGWNIKTLQYPKIPMTVAFHPSKKHLLISGGDDNIIRLWDITVGECIRTMLDHNDWVRSVVFSPDGLTLASGSDDQTVRIWNIESGYCIKTLIGYSNSIWALSLSPDDSTLASSGSDEFVRLWDVVKGDLQKTLRSHTSYVWAHTFSHDGQQLFSGSGDYTIKTWDVKSGRCVNTIQAHKNQVRSVALSPDGKLLASCGDDLTVRVWDLLTNEVRFIFTEHTSQVWCVVFSPDGRMLASAGDDRVILLWNIETGELIKSFKGHKNRILALDFSPNSKLIASGGEDLSIRIWDVNSINSTTIKSSKSSKNHQIEVSQVFLGHSNWVQSISFSPNGKIIASSSDDKTIKLWDIDNGECFRTLSHDTWVRATVFNSKGDFLISGTQGGAINVWNLHTGENQLTFRPPRPYEGMIISEIVGLNDAQLATLIALGAVDNG